MTDFRDRHGDCISLDDEQRATCDFYKPCSNHGCDPLCEDCHHTNFYRECTRPDEEEQ